MSKAQYLLLAAFIGFYGMLFTFLLVRAFAGIARAHMKRVQPAVGNATRPTKVTARRAWTSAVWRDA